MVLFPWGTISYILLGKSIWSSNHIFWNDFFNKNVCETFVSNPSCLCSMCIHRIFKAFRKACYSDPRYKIKWCRVNLSVVPLSCSYVYRLNLKILFSKTFSAHSTSGSLETFFWSILKNDEPSSPSSGKV